MPNILRDYCFAPKPADKKIFVRSIGHFNSPPNLRETRKEAVFAGFFWCIGGKGYFRLDNKVYTLKPNDTWYYPVGSYHDFWPGSDGFHYWWVSLEGDMANELCESLQLKAGLRNNFDCPVDLFKEIKDKICSNFQQDQIAALAILFKIMTLIAIPCNRTNNSSIEQKAHDIINENYTQFDLNIDKIANTLDVSRVVLSRSFSRNYHITISNYLKERRLAKALELLQKNDLIIKEIASLSGFSSADYFTKVFTLNFGMSPTEFKKKQNR